MTVEYRCLTCKATKTIKDRLNQPAALFPASVPCGWRGCADMAVRIRYTVTYQPRPGASPR